MTHVERLARFAAGTSYDDLSVDARERLKMLVLDALGCAIGALESKPLKAIRAHVDEAGGTPRATLIGGGKTAPDRAAFYNGALVRYLDFNDTYVARGESCHPSDNLGAVLAAAEYAHRTGREFLTALAVAYQVQCRLCDEAPVRHRGFDHVTQGAYASAAGVARALGLDAERTAHAVAISGTAFNALRVARTGVLSHWKGLAYPNTGFGGTHAALLAMRGITGPAEVFEGEKGFMDVIAGAFEIDWAAEGLERVLRVGIKKYNAEFHSQPALEAILDLRRDHDFCGDDVERVELDVFDVGYHIIGGGEEGDKKVVRTKEEADHSLPYLIAVAVLDGDVTPAQYEQVRIDQVDVQRLLHRVIVRPSAEYTRRFPDEMPTGVTVTLRGGRVLAAEKRDFEGFYSRPVGWEFAARKFESLVEPYTTPDLRWSIIDAVRQLDAIRVEELTMLLARVGRSPARPQQGSRLTSSVMPSGSS